MTSEQTTGPAAEPSPQPAPAEPTPAKRTLDDIYRDFPGAIQPQQQQMPPAQSVTEPVQPPPVTPLPAEPVPDPVTAPQEYAQWVAKQQAETNAQIRELSARHAREREEARALADRQDLAKAVESIREGIEEDPDILRGFLYAKAEDDRRLSQLFNNRHSNPSAWDAALSVLKDEAKSKFAAKTDAQLIENQAALDNAMRNASTQPPQDDDLTRKLMQKKPGEFAREWERIRKGVYDKR